MTGSSVSLCERVIDGNFGIASQSSDEFHRRQSLEHGQPFGFREESKFSRVAENAHGTVA